MMWPFNRKTSKNTFTPPSLDEIKKRARILVIDDNDFAYEPPAAKTECNT